MTKKPPFLSVEHIAIAGFFFPCSPEMLKTRFYHRPFAPEGLVFFSLQRGFTLAHVLKNVFTIAWGFLPCQNTREILKLQNTCYDSELQYTEIVRTNNKALKNIRWGKRSFTVSHRETLSTDWII